jgi:hypothetical protein
MGDGRLGVSEERLSEISAAASGMSLPANTSGYLFHAIPIPEVFGFS